MERSTAGAAGLVLGVVATAFGTLMTTPATASAGSLSCVSPPGRDTTSIIDRTACGAKSDPSSNSAALGNDGVGFADAAEAGAALGAGVGGGVGAAEARGSGVAAIAIGPKSVAIGTVAGSGPALVLSGPGGQALVADPARGVVCSGGPALAINFLAGQACFTDGVTVWRVS
jgi:hypothetical protein